MDGPNPMVQNHWQVVPCLYKFKSWILHLSEMEIRRNELCNVQEESCRYLKLKAALRCHFCRFQTAKKPYHRGCAFIRFRRLEMTSKNNVKTIDFSRLTSKPVNYSRGKDMSKLYDIDVEDAVSGMPYLMSALRPRLEKEIDWLQTNAGDSDYANFESGKSRVNVFLVILMGKFNSFVRGGRGRVHYNCLYAFGPVFTIDANRERKDFLQST